jgi:WD40 repeat protein
MFAALAALCLVVQPVRPWVDRLDPAAIPAAERFPWQPPELVGVLGTHRGRHWGDVLAAALSPDGAVVASGGTDRCIRLWAARDLTPLGCLEGHGDHVARVVFSPDGTLLATACDNSVSGGPLDRTVRLWRVAGKDSKPWATLKPHEGRVLALAFTADNKTLAAAGEDGLVRVWDLTGAEPAERVTFNYMPDRPDRGVWRWGTVVVFSPDGKHLVAAVAERGTSVVAWDVTTGTRRATLAEGDGWVPWVVFRPGGAVVRFPRPRKAAGTDKSVVPLSEMAEWDLSGDKPTPVERKKLGGETQTVAAARDGRVVVRAADGGVDVVRTGGDRDRTIAWLAGVGVTPGGLAPDGKALVGFTNSRVRVWEVVTGGVREVAADAYPTEPLFAAAFSPAGDRLYAVRSGRFWGDEVFLTWDLTGPNPVPTSARRMGARSGGRVVFAPAAAVAAVNAEPGGAVFDVPTGGAKSAAPGIDGGPYHESIKALAVSPDGRRMATSAAASFLGNRLTWRVAVWDVGRPDAALVRTLPAAARAASALAFSPDGRALVVGHQDGGVGWWDVAADPPREVRRWQPHDREVSALAVAPGGKEVATGCVQVRWGPVGEPGSVVAEDTTWAVRVEQMEFTPDGNLLVVLFTNGRLAAVDRTGKAAVDIRPGPGRCGRGGFGRFGLTGDGRHAAVPTANGLVYVLRLRR